MAEAQAVKTPPPSHDSVLNRVAGDAPVVAATAMPNTQDAPQEAAHAEEAKTEIPVQAKVNYEDVPDDELLAILEKRTGKKITSLDELKAPAKQPTKEELEAQEAEEKAEALEWALGNKKITLDQYNKSVSERAKNKRDVALDIFTQELRAEDKDLSAEECEERFAEYFCEHEEEGSWKRKKAIKEMNAMADNHLAQFSAIDKLPEEYRQHKTSDEQRKAYNKQISTLAKELPTELSFSIPYTTVSGQQLTLESKIPVDEKIVATLVKELTRPGMELSELATGKPEAIKGELMYHLEQRMRQASISKIVQDVASQIETDVMARLKNSVAPQQSLAGAQQNGGAPKPPPSHDSVLNKVK